jgi:hypothetical protein
MSEPIVLVSLPETCPVEVLEGPGVRCLSSNAWGDHESGQGIFGPAMPGHREVRLEISAATLAVAREIALRLVHPLGGHVPIQAPTS